MIGDPVLMAETSVRGRGDDDSAGDCSVKTNAACFCVCVFGYVEGRNRRLLHQQGGFHPRTEEMMARSLMIH